MANGDVSQIDGVTVSVENRSQTPLENQEQWGHVARQALVDEGVERGHVDVVFVDSKTMCDLNLEHMGYATPTDVLAFPMDAPDEYSPSVGLVDPVGVRDEPPLHLDEPPLHLGDIVICPEVAVHQAPGHAGTIESEFCLLTIHAVLHILGHDHLDDGDRRVMQEREHFHLSKLGYEHPEIGLR